MNHRMQLCNNVKNMTTNSVKFLRQGTSVSAGDKNTANADHFRFFGKIRPMVKSSAHNVSGKKARSLRMYDTSSHAFEVQVYTSSHGGRCRGGGCL